MDAMAPVEQINAWVNLWIKNHLGDTYMTVEYSSVSPYFVDEQIDKLLKLAQYGIPVKLELASLTNANPVKERGMSYMEEVLGLANTAWNKPLMSSNVQSGMTENGDGSDGRAKTDNPEDLTDEGQATRDKK
jgi:hypothetical protein